MNQWKLFLAASGDEFFCCSYYFIPIAAMVREKVVEGEGDSLG
jgi:hypothetical protein